MTLRGTTKALEEPKIVLAAPGSVTPRHRLTQVLAAGSLLAMGLRPAPRAAAANFNVTNLHDTGAGSLRAAIDNANANPGADAITFQPGLVGTIPITTQISISDLVHIIGPGPGLLSVSGSNLTRVFYLSSTVLFTTTISGLTLRNGSGNSNGGGAILDFAQPLTLDNVNLISNTTTGSGGAVRVFTGVVDQGAFTVRDSLVTGNHADRGGAVALYSVSGGVLVSSTQFISNSAGSRGGALFARDTHGLSTTIQGSTFLSNSSGNRGGAVFLYKTGVTTIQNTTVSGNSAVRGGGLFLYKTAATTIQSSTISGNRTTTKGGGGVFLYTTYDVTIQDSTIRDNQANTYGGGLVVQVETTGQVVIRRSTISGNNALVGGGMWFYDISSPVLLEDSTVSGNSALSGGGLYVASGSAGTIAIQNSDIVSNSAAATGGGVLLAPAVGGTLALTNTIIANNSAITGTDLSNTLGAFRLRSDLVEITSTASISDAGGNLFGLDPLLGPLANNGGPTQTHLPLLGSPVINAGDPAFAPPPTVDQRGQPRVQAGRIDIGALETVAKLFLPLLRR